MMRILLIAGVFLLASCITTTQDTSTKAFLTACSGYATALSALSGYRAAGQLSDAQVATVDRIRPALNKACRGNANVTLALVAAVQSGVAQLITIKGAVQ